MAVPAPPRSPYRTLLTSSGFARVFVAGLGSIAGSSIAGICLIWLVFAETGSALDVGLLGTAQVAGGILFSVFGGTLVDRYDRRRLMILADLSRAAAMAVVVAVLALVGFDLPTVLGAAFVVGAFTTVFQPAEQSVIPALVPAALVADANGLVRSSRSALQFVGASVAGVLIVTVGATIGIAFNAVTFAVSASLLFGMSVASPRRAAGAAGAKAAGYLADLKEGFAWLYRSKGFFQLTISATFFNFCASLVGTFLVFYATEVLHGSALLYALLLAVEVAGTGIGSLLVSRTGGVRRAGRAWVVPYGAASGAVVLALTLVPESGVALAGLFLLGLFGGYAGTAWLTAAQLLVPAEMQGRYFGIDSLGSIAIIPASQIGGAFLIAAYGVREAYLATAIVWIAAGLFFLVPRALGRLGVRPDGTGQVP
ncbi:MAG TPA: MFS transporter [Thermoplasmata archaeon]|nr:MFS transporter [Thermoplasmata archaeon]